MPVDFSVTLTRGTSRILCLASAVCALLSVADPSSVRAADFDIKPQYSQSFEVDSNPLLNPNGGQTLFGSVFMPEVTISRSTADSTISMDNRLDISRFNLDQFSSSDVHSTLFGKKSWSSSYFSMSGKLDYDTTRNSEYNNSGINVAGIRHTGLSIAPEYGITLDQRNQLVIDANASNADYANTRIYQNYVIYGFTPSLQHSFDAQDVGELILQTSHYNTTSGLRNTANTVGPALGWKRQMTPLVNVTVSGGYQMVRLDIARIGISTGYDYFYNVDIGYKDRRNTFDLTSSRGVEPQSSGQVTTATAIGFSGGHTFNETIADKVFVNYEMDDYTNPFPNNKESYIDFYNKLLYQLTDRWQLQPMVEYKREGRFGNINPAHSEAVLISIAYTPADFQFK